MRRILSAEELRAEIPHVTSFCCDIIRQAADPDSEEGTTFPRSRLRKMNALELHEAAVALTVKLVDIQEAEKNGIDNKDAVLDAVEIAAFMPLITVDATANDRRRARIIAHELATEIQKTRVARELFDADTVECPGKDGRKVRHRIARQVEETLCETEPWDDPQ